MAKRPKEVRAADASERPVLVGLRRVIHWPGWFSLAAASAAAATCLLDVACVLPHPAAAPPAAPPVRAARAAEVRSGHAHGLPRGLPSAEVRARYHARLQALADFARSYRANLTLAAEHLVGEDVKHLSVACRLAAASVREREVARVEARLQGSAGMHLTLILRDLYVYGSFEPFTLEAMMRQKRAKLAKASSATRGATGAAGGGAAPSDNDVCLALVESSTRTNQDYDRWADALGEVGVGYAQETAALYLLPAGVLVSVAYLAEAAFSCRHGSHNCGKRD